MDRYRKCFALQWAVSVEIQKKIKDQKKIKKSLFDHIRRIKTKKYEQVDNTAADCSSLFTVKPV